MSRAASRKSSSIGPEREAGTRLAGIAVAIHCTKGVKGNINVCMALPWLCEDNSTAHYNIYIIPSNREELVLESLKFGESVIGTFRLKEQNPPLPMSFMASFP